MDTDLLIGDIVRQTTVLIAQLSTAAGLRSPLARVADQVFLDLASELEAQGVRKKVAADMFGMALRSYQLKVKRVREAIDESQGTLWQAIYDQLEEASRTRKEVQALFRSEDPGQVAATLQDMVQSGIAYCSGAGDSTLFGLTNQSDRERLGLQDSALASMVWYLAATDTAQTRDELLEQVKCQPEELDKALEELEEEGRLELKQGRLIAHRLEIPVGAEKGWEVAVCDHYRAVTTAIAAKVARGPLAGGAIGGGTVSYRVPDAHPLREQVFGQLERVRKQANDLWREVADYNDEHGVDETFSRVTFYFGQNVVENDAREEEP